MKKLLLMLGAMATAIACNAAAAEWGSGTITLAGGATAAKGDVTGYLFLVDATTYGTYSSYTDGKALSDAVYAAYGSSLGSADSSKASTKKGVVTLTDATDYSTGNTAYGVVLFVEGDNYMGNVATYTFDSSMDAVIDNLAITIGGDVGGGSSATAWSTAAVPEPTSGLLMLLGMAGLALRRRRA